jgi:hypothetical protein
MSKLDEPKNPNQELLDLYQSTEDQAKAAIQTLPTTECKEYQILAGLLNSLKIGKGILESLNSTQAPEPQAIQIEDQLRAMQDLLHGLQKRVQEHGTTSIQALIIPTLDLPVDFLTDNFQDPAKA